MAKVIAALFPAHYPVHLLQHTKISEIAIPNQIITLITAGTHISAVLETLSRANVVSAPVLTEDGKLFGFVDMLDIVALFEHFKQRSLPISQFFSTHVEKAIELPMALEVPALSGVPRHPVVEMPHTTTMADLFDRFARSSLHRIAMTKDGKVTAIITQRDILRWITKNIKAFEHPSLMFNVNKTMAELGFGGPSERPVETVTEGTFTLEAFARMRNRNVSCVPVVNDKGLLTHVLSASDLRSLSVSNIDLLEQPLRIFLSKRPASTLVTATRDHKFSEVLRRLDESGRHRIVLTDNELKPITVVSLSDIIPLFAVIAQK